MSAKVRIQVPATTANIGPGYDSFGMALTYYNFVEAEIGERAKETTLTIVGEGADRLAKNSANLLARSVSAAAETAGCADVFFKLRAENNIPLSRGMGSSSAAIVGGIFAANLLLGEPLSKHEMLKLATRIEGHADNVAPALFGGFTIVTMEKGQPHLRKIEVPDGLYIVLAVPDFTLSTKRVRAIMPPKVSLSDAVYNTGHAALLTAALAAGDWQDFGRALCDRLHQPYRFPLIPGAEQVAEAARTAGALGCVISGSGPTMIAFSAEQAKTEAIGEAMVSAFAKAGLSARMIMAQPGNQGVVQL